MAAMVWWRRATCMTQARAVSVYVLKSREDDHIAALRERAVPIIAPNALEISHFRQCDVIVDALLGTGASRSITGDLAKVLTLVSKAVSERRNAAPDLINPALPTPASRVPLIVAVDGPTGLNYDTGELDPLTVPADVSVTFAYPKIGHTRFPGAGACGELIVADIGTDPKLADDIAAEMADPALVRAWLPKRPANAHKGTFGKTLIVSGSTLYTGAPNLAATAAYRAGAGLVTLAIPQAIHAILASKSDEATFRPLPDRSGVLSAEAATEIRDLLETYDVALIGPGLTTGAQAFIAAFLGLKTSTALVLDADALNCLAHHRSVVDASDLDGDSDAVDFDAASGRDVAADEVEPEGDRGRSGACGDRVCEDLGTRRGAQGRVYGDRRARWSIDLDAVCQSRVGDGGQRRCAGGHHCGDGVAGLEAV